MEKETVACNCDHHHHRSKMTGASSGAYGLAFLGAFIYYVQHADTFWVGVMGFLKALVWPAVLIYKVLGFLKM